VWPTTRCRPCIALTKRDLEHALCVRSHCDLPLHLPPPVKKECVVCVFFLALSAQRCVATTPQRAECPDPCVVCVATTPQRAECPDLVCAEVCVATTPQRAECPDLVCAEVCVATTPQRAECPDLVCAEVCVATTPQRAECPDLVCAEVCVATTPQRAECPDPCVVCEFQATAIS
jgi:hypothetical protein